MRSVKKAISVFSLSLVAVMALAVSIRQAGANDQNFWSENAAAMDRMMAAMTVTSSGDADRDFVASMVPHHEGAVDMAVLELRYGHNEQLRRLAQEIIVTQQQEIVVMQQAIKGSH